MKCAHFLFAVILIASACDKFDNAGGAVGTEPDPPSTDLSETQTFEHPDGVYRADVPVAWGIVPDPKPGPFGTMQLSRGPDMMVSYVLFPDGVEPDLEEHMARFFADEQPVGDLVSEELSGGKAAHRMYGRDGEEPWRWWIRVIAKDGVLLTATVSDGAARFDAASDAYLKPLRSIEVLELAELPDDALPTTHRESDLQRIFENTPRLFWGRAVDDKGTINPVSPETEESRLIEGDEATAIANEALDVGLAQWCGMNWKPPYYAAQDARRKAGWPERKVAYAGTLFGAAQARIQQRVKADVGDCTRAHRKLVERRLAARAAQTGDE